jgi:hypothetical protein
VIIGSGRSADARPKAMERLIQRAVHSRSRNHGCLAAIIGSSGSMGTQVFGRRIRVQIHSVRHDIVVMSGDVPSNAGGGAFNAGGPSHDCAR